MPASREATCQCGRLRVVTTGDPVAVSVCHCLECQRRTGSAFATQAAFLRDQVRVTGSYRDYARRSDDPEAREHVFHFCPECGSQVFQSEPSEPDFVIVSVGAFADPSFPPPTESVYDSRRHPWVGLPDSIQVDPHLVWERVRPLYDAGRYAEAADMGRELLEAYPGQGRLVYNLACCESLAGRTSDAIEHLRQAIGIWDGCREMARGDGDFDPIRDEPAFIALVGG